MLPFAATLVVVLSLLSLVDARIFIHGDGPEYAAQVQRFLHQIALGDAGDAAHTSSYAAGHVASADAKAGSPEADKRRVGKEVANALLPAGVPRPASGSASSPHLMAPTLVGKIVLGTPIAASHPVWAGDDGTRWATHGKHVVEARMVDVEEPPAGKPTRYGYVLVRRLLDSPGAIVIRRMDGRKAPQTTDITKTAGGYWGMQLSTLPFKQQSAGSFAKLVGIDVAATHALYTSTPSKPFMYIGIPGRDQWKASQLLETEIFVRRQRVYSSSRGGVSSSASSYELGVETFAKYPYAMLAHELIHAQNLWGGKRSALLTTRQDFQWNVVASPTAGAKFKRGKPQTYHVSDTTFIDELGVVGILYDKSKVGVQRDPESECGGVAVDARDGCVPQPLVPALSGTVGLMMMYVTENHVRAENGLPVRVRYSPTFTGAATLSKLVGQDFV